MKDEQNEHDTDNNEEPKRDKGPGDCLTPTATVLVLLVIALVRVGRWVVGA